MCRAGGLGVAVTERERRVDLAVFLVLLAVSLWGIVFATFIGEAG